MSNLIEDRDERTRKRKKNKRRMDDLIGLSYNDEEKQKMILSAPVDVVTLANEVDTMELSEKKELADKKIRLLDEGFFDQGFVIKKGTIEKYLNGKNEKIREVVMTEDGDWEYGDVLNLTDDFVGTVNLGHMDFSVFPFIIGEWKKEDLSLVDIGNDRVGLDVDLNLDKNSIFVKELKRQPYDIGVSAEFYYAVNYDDTEALSEMLGTYTLVIDEIFIFAYGLVGECGNVNSSGLELKGEKEMPNEIKESIEEVKEDVIEMSEDVSEELTEEDAEETAEVMEESEEAEADAIEAAPEEMAAEAEEEVIEATYEEEESDEEEEEDEDDEEAEDEEIDQDVDDEAFDDETDLDEVLNLVSDLKKQVGELTAKVRSLEEANCELKKTNKRLNKKLKDEKDKKDSFIRNAKDISVKLGVNEDKPKEKKSVADTNYAFGDGIGE